MQQASSAKFAPGLLIQAEGNKLEEGWEGKPRDNNRSLVLAPWNDYEGILSEMKWM